MDLGRESFEGEIELHALGVPPLGSRGLKLGRRHCLDDDHAAFVTRAGGIVDANRDRHRRVHHNRPFRRELLRGHRPGVVDVLENLVDILIARTALDLQQAQLCAVVIVFNALKPCVVEHKFGIGRTGGQNARLTFDRDSRHGVLAVKELRCHHFAGLQRKRLGVGRDGRRVGGVHCVHHNVEHTTRIALLAAVLDFFVEHFHRAHFNRGPAAG